MRRQVALQSEQSGRQGQRQQQGAGVGAATWRIVYGNINTYRAFTEDCAAPISSMDFLRT